MEDVTPIRKQYLEIKKKYPGMLLFFRLGDFYETFDEDAQITSRELEIVLTSRNVAKGNRVPMAGIPFHAVDNYLGRLITKGYHVAICEQVGSQPKNGLFPREVVRIITPGTLLETDLLPQDKPNYLMSYLVENDGAGISYVDISTGEFKSTQVQSRDIANLVRTEISRLAPAEVLLPENAQTWPDSSFHTTRLPAWKFELSYCSEILKNHFRVASMDGFGLRGSPLAIRTAGVILDYVSSTQPAILPALTKISNYSLSEFLSMDSVTRRNLELTASIRNGDETGSLLRVLDRTRTPMGHRLIREWINKPLLNIQDIRLRQEKVELLTHGLQARKELFAILKGVVDLERLANRIVASQAMPREILALRDTLDLIPQILKILTRNDLSAHFSSSLPSFEAEEALIRQSINEDSPATLQNTGIIRQGYSAELDQILETTQDARQWIADLEEIEKKRTRIKTLKVGYNKIFGYYIEISKGAASGVPAEYIRKQTLVNAERFITSEMKEYEAVVLNADERIHSLEISLFREILGKLSASHAKLMAAAKAIAELDVLLSFAETSVNNQYVRPVLTEDATMDITDSRHPVVEKLLDENRFIPNNAAFPAGEYIQIITGPNMSGKSTYLRQVALIVLMAQIGCFVPAASARIGIVDRIFTRIGAQDEIFSGQSTFMVEMTETAAILNSATHRSLLILDEIGRGTSTYDGVAIAWSVIEYIHNHPDLKARTLFATHYHELIELGNLLPGVKNYNIAVIESDGKIVFLHKIVEGGSDRSYGIHVAQLAGMPASVIQRAYEILQMLEASPGGITRAKVKQADQLRLFPDTDAMKGELSRIDLNTISPLEALNRLYEWKKKYLTDD